MEDIKQNITDNQYKIIMDTLMKIKNGKNILRFITLNKNLMK